MKKVSTYLVPLLLLMVFSLKVGLQMAANVRYAEKAVAEQQDGKSTEDKSNEKSENNKGEFLAIFALRPLNICISNDRPTTSAHTHNSLPVQYFAIPTPPPWRNI